LARIANAQFDRLDGAPLVEAFWRPHFQRFAHWFAATEADRRRGVTAILTEADGALDLTAGGGFRLTARADRIDVKDGAAVIYDYKTGKPPAPKHVEEHYAPQLSLEAAIAEAGGFEGLDTCEVGGLVYIHVSGRNDGGEERAAASKVAPSALAKLAVDKLDKLVTRYADPTMPYEVKRRSAQAFRRLYDYDDYEQLARVKEWLTEEAEEDFG
jgi:ATP-dependent helicase/nuclease subunit B